MSATEAEIAAELAHIDVNCPFPEDIKSQEALKVLEARGWASINLAGALYLPTVRGQHLLQTAEILVEGLKRWRSNTESDLSDTRTDHYKPFYGALAVLIAPCYRREMGLCHEKDGCFTQTECETILRLAHPYFTRALAEDPETFVSNYGFIHGAWYEESSSNPF